ncbi:MAG: ribonuclease HII [Candidatus Nanopelagicales bacterium]|nr:ribonuclease HII [Candidatus Nanopelagicales bacterium]
MRLKQFLMPRAKKNRPTLDFENNLFSRGAKLIAGMDEVGRGCLAGPVSVGVAVISSENINPPENLADSKLLTHEQREELLPLVKTWVKEFAVGHASNDEIDEIGLTRALRRAGRRALAQLDTKPDHLILDGKHNWLIPEKETQDMFEQEFDDGPLSVNLKIIAQVKADLTCASVAAASIVAKTTRDQMMSELSKEFPNYFWAENKGYAAPEHLEAIKSFGATKYHRVSWKTFQK